MGGRRLVSASLGNGGSVSFLVFTHRVVYMLLGSIYVDVFKKHLVVRILHFRSPIGSGGESPLIKGVKNN